ncbi:hypothetical protein ACNQKV_000521 [Staphylococcus pseudintermedius]
MNYYVIKYTITEYFDEVEEKPFNVSNLFTSKEEAKEHLVREGYKHYEDDQYIIGGNVDKVTATIKMLKPYGEF